MSTPEEHVGFKAPGAAEPSLGRRCPVTLFSTRDVVRLLREAGTPLGISTIKVHAREGLLPVSVETSGGLRLSSEADVQLYLGRVRASWKPRRPRR